MTEDSLITTQKNLLKRAPTSGHLIMNGPNVSFFFGSGYYNELHIPHLVKDANGNPVIPLFRVYYEPWGDGKILMGMNDSDWAINNPPNDNVATSGAGPAMMAYATEEELVIVLLADHNMNGTDIPVYFVIYEDYSLEA